MAEEAKKATARFEKCFDFVIGREGGYVNDPDDAGGETKYGISKRAYPGEDIKNLTLERAREIYKKDYWKKCGCDELPEGIDVIVFDTAVNSGPGRAIKFLDITKDPIAYLMQRDEFYNSIVKNKPSQKKFLKGWRNRLNHLREFVGLPHKQY